MKPDELDRVREFLLGRDPPWATPHLREMAALLPVAAEATRCALPGTAALPWDRLKREISASVIPHAARNEPGWVEVAGALVACVDVLAPRTQQGSPEWPLAATKNVYGGLNWNEGLSRFAPSLPGLEKVARSDGLRDAWERLRRPDVHILLRDGTCARVFFVPGAPAPNATLETRLLESLGASGGTWAYDREVSGTSAMAGRVVRALAGVHPKLAEIRTLGVTGEIDSNGRIVPVDALIDKVRGFFQSYPQGRCVVPASQAADLVALRPVDQNVDEILSGRRRDDTRLDHDQWGRILPVESIQLLMLRLGITWDDGPACRLFGIARAQSDKAQDWRGRSVQPSTWVGLRIIDAANAPPHRGYVHGHTLQEILARPVGTHPGAVLTGRPGSGKSVLVRQAYALMNAGHAEVPGPALLAVARNWPSGGSVASGIASSLGISTADVQVVLDNPSIGSGVTLLVDGLDELPAPRRAEVLTSLTAWTGPWLLATRAVPESLPPGRRFAVADLKPHDASKLLEREGRKDLSDRLRALDRLGPNPADRLLTELSRTPLGVSLLALAWDSEPRRRQDLLRNGILHLVRRAESDGRLDAATRRRFERVGPRLLGAAAWRMLRAGREHLFVEDLEHAERILGLDPSDADVLHHTVEAGGFVQPVGPGRWEFSHRTFAEYTAAVFLVGQGPLGLEDVVAALGEPATNEVIVHLGALLDDPGPLIRRLLDFEDRPFSAIALATRIGLEGRDTGGGTELAEVAIRRIRLTSAFLRTPLPAGAADVETLFMLIERRQPAMIAHRERLVAACPASFRSYIDGTAPIRSDEIPWELRDRSSERHPGVTDYGEIEIARRLVDALELQTTALARLRLGATPRESDLLELEHLLNEPFYSARANDAWYAVAPKHRLLEKIADLASSARHTSDILRAVSDVGSPLQIREALLRVSAASIRYEVKRDRDDSTWAQLRELELTPHQWLSLWSWAWSSGFLGNGPDEAEPLYATLLRDEHPAARWRAVVGLTRLSEKVPADRGYGQQPRFSHGQRAELRVSVADSDCRVRVEALAALARARQVEIKDVARGLISAHQGERLVALDALHAANKCLAFEIELQMLFPNDELEVMSSVPYSERPPKPATTPFEESLAKNISAARHTVLSTLKERLRDRSAWRACLNALGEPGLGPVAAEVLDSSSHDLEILLTVAGHRNASARAWLVERLKWRREPDALEALRSLARDSDRNVASLARAAVERASEDTDWHREPPGPVPLQSAVSRARPMTVEAALSYPGYGHASRGNDPTMLKTLTEFRSAWSWLSENEIAWETFHDQEGSWTEEGIDFMVELTRQAADANRSTARGIVEHLAALYTQDWRPILINALGDPRLGLWAEQLLARETRDSDLLPVFRYSADGAVRASRLAQGTPLVGPAVRAFLDALVSAPWPKLETILNEPSQFGNQWREPSWLHGFRKLAGLEGLAILLVAEPPSVVREHALRAVEAHEEEFAGSISVKAREELATWARRLLHEAASDEASRLLSVLALVGSPSDATSWLRRLELETDLAVQLQVGGFKVIGRLGAVTDTGAVIGLAMSDRPLPVVIAALRALADLADEQTVGWLLDRLDDPPPTVRNAARRLAELEAARRSRSEAQRVARQEAQAAGRDDWWEAGRTPEEDLEDFPIDFRSWHYDVHRAVLRAGSEAQGIKLATILSHSSGAIELAEEHGRLGSHALLVLGAVEHDPGERVMPREVTGGGDEVIGSDVPERANAAVERIVSLAGAESVRRAFLEAVLEGIGDLPAADDQFGRLGGAKNRDVPRLLERLNQHPADRMALQYLAEAGGGEAELVRIWREHDVPWIWPLSGAST